VEPLDARIDSLNQIKLVVKAKKKLIFCLGNYYYVLFFKNDLGD
jgi:hypothetical protein